MVRSAVTGIWSAPDAQLSSGRTRTSNGAALTIDWGWLDGLGGLLAQLANEIRLEFNREPDAGDLLLALSVAPRTLTARAREELDVDADALRGQVERTRREFLQAQGRPSGTVETLVEIRRRLGLPDPSPDGPQGPSSE
jgi:hypothetical protein